MQHGWRKVFATEWFDIQELDDPAGKPWYAIRQPDGIVVLAITTDGAIVLVRQWRPPRNRLSLELPAGAVDPDEAPLIAAQRELHEETGFRGGNWHALGAYGLALNRDTNCMHLFVVDGVDCDPEWTPESGVEVLLVSPPELRSVLLSGELEQLAAAGLIQLAQWRCSEAIPALRQI